MKKCPKCKAEIQEEARFCLYCMTSFEEKQTIETPNENNKRWLIIIAAVLVLILIVVGILLFAQKETPNNEGTDNSTSSSVSSNLDTSDDNTTSSEQQNSESQGNETSTPTSNNQTQSSSKNEGNTANNSSGNTTTTNSTTSNNSQNSNKNSTTNSTSNSTSANSTSSSNKTESSNTSSSTSTTTPSQTMVTYIYRDAVPADDYTASTTITNNAVVITGVKNISNSGIYEIPATIGGKKVVAIMDNAFCEDEIKDTVKQVIIPSTVKTINAYAFYKCYNLTDIYINGEAVACPSVIIPNKSNRNFEITIHASSACHDRNFHTYKTLSTYWEVNFKEWNG